MSSKPKLFCFSFAGGTAAFFNEIEKELPVIEFVKMDYKGHGSRYKEPFAADFSELADDAYQCLRRRYDGDEYGLFGYSMGTITVVEVLRRIMADPDMTLPTHIFLAAHEPHSKMELSGFTAEKLDEWIKERTLLFGGIPEKLILNKPFWRMYLPIYRADYNLIKDYEFEKIDFKIDIPADIFYSESDTPRSEMEKWKYYFTGSCEYHCYEGNHFFIRNHYKEIARTTWQRMNPGGQHDF